MIYILLVLGLREMKILNSGTSRQPGGSISARVEIVSDSKRRQKGARCRNIIIIGGRVVDRVC